MRRDRVSAKPYLIVTIIFAVICFGGYGLIRLRDAWRASAEDCFRRPARELRLPASAGTFVSAVAIAPDGQHALAGTDLGKLIYYELPSGKVVREIEVVPLADNMNLNVAAAFLPDGKRAVTESNAKFALWDLTDGRELRSHDSPSVTDIDCPLAVSPDGKMLLFGVSRGAGLLDLMGARPAKYIQHPALHTTATTAVGWTPDGRRALLGCWHGELAVWDVVSGGDDLTVYPNPGGVAIIQALVCLPDGKRVLVGDANGEIRLLDLADLTNTLLRLPNPDTQVTSLAVSPDGRLAVAGYVFANDSRDERSPPADFRALRLWDLETGKPVRDFRFPRREGELSHEVRAVAFTPDGRHVLSGGYWESDGGWQSHPELLYWRVPDRVGCWLLGHEE